MCPHCTYFLDVWCETNEFHAYMQHATLVSAHSSMSDLFKQDECRVLLTVQGLYAEVPAAPIIVAEPPTAPIIPAEPPIVAAEPISAAEPPMSPITAAERPTTPMSTEPLLSPLIPELPALSTGFMADLFTDFPASEDLTMHQKLDVLLENQKLLFNFLIQQSGPIPSLHSVVQPSPTSLVTRRLVEQLSPRMVQQPSPSVLQQQSHVFQRPSSIDEEDNFLREAVKIKSGCCSIGNFATKLLQCFYSKEELVNRNFTGTRGKQLLDQVKLSSVKKYVFKL